MRERRDIIERRDKITHIDMRETRENTYDIYTIQKRYKRENIEQREDI